MPRFDYHACNNNGAEQAGTVEAATPDEAVVRLKSMGLFPLRVSPLDDRERETPRRKPFYVWQQIRMQLTSGAMARPERAVFLRQLATMLAAGLPLVRALEVLARQQKNRRLNRMCGTMIDHLRSGGSLSDALARHPRVFAPATIKMVRAGEAGGMLAEVMGRIAGFEEKSLRLRGKIRAATVYPAVVLSVAAAILAGLLVFVVPRFEQIFSDLLKGAPLPVLTRFVLSVSAAVQEHFPSVAAAGAGLGLGLVATRKTRRGLHFLDRATLKLPVIGGLVLKTAIARLTRTLGTLLASGVPILPALLITRDTCRNAAIADALGQVHDRLKQGGSVAFSLEQTLLFPPLVSSLVEVGEHTGRLSEMLGRLADIHDEEVDNTVAALSSLLEPALIVLLALVVGTIVIALFLPVIRIVQLLT